MCALSSYSKSGNLQKQLFMLWLSRQKNHLKTHSNRKNPTLYKIIFRWQRPQERPSEASPLSEPKGTLHAPWAPG